MSATGNVALEQEIGDRNEAPVAAGQHLYRGSMAFGDVAGRATTVLGAKFLGHVVAEANNSSGGAGAINVILYGGRYRLQVPLSDVALTSIGAQVFASDNNTLTLTPGANTLVGRVVRYVTTDTAIVEFAPVNYAVATVVEQAHIADAKVNYTTGDLDTEAELITAFNTTNAKINALLAALEAAAVLASS
jgi:hypothetical protein